MIHSFSILYRHEKITNRTSKQIDGEATRCVNDRVVVVDFVVILIIVARTAVALAEAFGEQLVDVLALGVAFCTLLEHANNVREHVVVEDRTRRVGQVERLLDHHILPLVVRSTVGRLRRRRYLVPAVCAARAH